MIETSARSAYGDAPFMAAGEVRSNRVLAGADARSLKITHPASEVYVEPVSIPRNSVLTDQREESGFFQARAYNPPDLERYARRTAGIPHGMEPLRVTDTRRRNIYLLLRHRDPNVGFV